MISIINSWAQGIILAIIIATIIEIILPEGNNKKYIKTVIGVYILFVMIQPLISSNKIEINSIIKDTRNKMDEYKTEDLTLETNQYIEETYLTKIQKDIREKVKNKGYNIDLLNLDIETNNEEFYGEVKSISIQISKREDMKENSIENTIEKINDIKIDISNETIVNEENKSEEITEDDIEEIKKYLSNEYGTKKEKIHINE